MIKDLILKTRSVRRFYQDVPIEVDTLRQLVDLARYAPSATNMQPLKYIICCDPKWNEKIFPHLGIGNEECESPAEGERPSAYIIILHDTTIAMHGRIDHGIAAQYVMLGATEMGLGGFMLGYIQREKIAEVLGLTDRYKVLLVVALGKPKEEVVLETVGPDGNTSWWHDSDGVHHIPKRKLDEIIVDEKY
ncbi:nitroreductase family protein [Chloroflexota bacterium]